MKFDHISKSPAAFQNTPFDLTSVSDLCSCSFVEVQVDQTIMSLKEIGNVLTDSFHIQLDLLQVSLGKKTRGGKKR